jgi:hypothetical protein
LPSTRRGVGAGASREWGYCILRPFCDGTSHATPPGIAGYFAEVSDAATSTDAECDHANQQIHLGSVFVWHYELHYQGKKIHLEGYQTTLTA